MHNVIIIQRICPHYRVPVFQYLAKRVNILLYFGKGQKSGAFQNAKVITGFPNKQLKSCGFSVNFQDRSYYISWFPFLFFNLFIDRPSLILTEGTTNIINNFTVFLFCFFTKTPYIWWDAGRNPNLSKNIIRVIFETILSFLITHSCACIAYGENAKKYFLSKRVPEKKIFIAQNTADFSFTDEKSQKYSVKLNEERIKYSLFGKKIILYVGALEKRRNVDLLLCAYAQIKLKYKDIVLIIIGDGPEKNKLEQKVELEYFINDIHFLGRIIDEVELYFMLCDIFVLPGWSSLSINQAMVYGKPVITVPYGGPEYELVENGRTGFIIERNNVQQLINGFLLILQNDTLQRSMGIAARKKVLNQASINNMIGQIALAINYVLKKNA